MKLFFFDTETTWLYPWVDHIIQFWGIAWVLNEETFEFEETERINQLINTDTYISPMATAVHWLRNEDLLEYDYIDSYIQKFLDLINDADYVVGHNISFDANMIILAPFLFRAIKFSPNKKVLLYNNKKIFKTFTSIKENGQKRQRQDLNNFFIMPFSLENKGNDILKNDQKNLLYNDDEENDLFLDTGLIEKNNNVKIDNDLMNEIYGIDNESKAGKEENKRYTVQLKDTGSSKSKRSIFTALRLSKQSNCCNDLYNFFFTNYFYGKFEEKI